MYFATGTVHEPGERLLIFELNSQWSYTSPFHAPEAVLTGWSIVHGSIWAAMCFERSHRHLEDREENLAKTLVSSADRAFDWAISCTLMRYVSGGPSLL